MYNDQTNVTTYIVQPGDSLWAIAKRYNTSVDVLKQLNYFTDNTIIPGETIKVPTSEYPKSTTIYTVQPGDSLWTIAKKFGTTIDDLKAINNLYNNQIYPGQTLKIDTKLAYSTHTVDMGESLWIIANYYGMSVEELKTLNHLSTNEIYPGQTLTVIQRQLPPEITTITYTVKQGDSLWEIAIKFGTTVEEIKMMNGLSSNALTIGQELTILKSITPTDAKILIKVKRYNGTVQQIPLEEYVTGVVSSELSAGFNEEAYKALALAARTYAVRRLREGATISDTASHQVYKDKAQLKEWWGDDFEEIYSTIRTAVCETKGEVIVYDGDLIDSLFFSTSNGRTEEPRYVWGGDLPYLKSVSSSWDTKSPHYYDVKNLSYAEFRRRLGLSSGASLYANVQSRTSGDSVDKINISGKTFTGEQVRKKLALKSTDFDIKFSNGRAIIRQRGWGHQVGLSQYGAHFMGEEGYNYRQIIKHYYPGVNIERVL